MTLGSREVHVWHASLDVHWHAEIALLDLLDADERVRADSFRVGRDRSVYVIAHGLLRALLAGYVGRPAERLTFTSNAYGKPSLVAPCDGVEFSVSHSGDIVVIGVAQHPLGVDVECWSDGIDYDRLASTVFSATELEEWRDVAPASKASTFYAGWTRKEAYLKATGFGVTRGLVYFDVSLDPNAPPRLLADRLTANAVGYWTLHDLAIAPGYTCCVAADRSCNEVSCRSLPSDERGE